MDALLENITSFWKSADVVYNLKYYTSATILYFKCLFVILDLIILKKKKKTPKDHTERFRILQQDFQDIYAILDKLFMIYRDTYSMQIEKNKCDNVRDYVIKLAEEQRIQLNHN